MTPLHMIREVPSRSEGWPLFWKVVAASTVSMFVAVVLLAWQAAKLQRHLRDSRPPRVEVSAPRFDHAAYMRNMAINCRVYEEHKAAEARR